MTKKFDLLRRGDVMHVIDEYRQSILRELDLTPKDLALHHRLAAVRDIEHRLMILERGGLVLIQGGLSKNTNNNSV